MNWHHHASDFPIFTLMYRAGLGPRLRESRLLASSGRGRRVHATQGPLFRPALYIDPKTPRYPILNSQKWSRLIVQGWAKEMELSWEKVSARLQPATAGHARLVLSKTVSLWAWNFLFLFDISIMSFSHPRFSKPATRGTILLRKCECELIYLSLLPLLFRSRAVGRVVAFVHNLMTLRTPPNFDDGDCWWHLEMSKLRSGWVKW